MNNGKQPVNQVEVRVRQTAGGPQIFVDGKPVAPHMFWGRETLEAQPVATDWRHYSIAFEPAVSIEDARVEFFFEPTIGTLEVRDFSFGSCKGLSWKIERATEGEDAEPMKRDIPAGRLEGGRLCTMSFEARGDGISWIRPLVAQHEAGPYHYSWVHIPPANPAQNSLVTQAKMALAAGVKFMTFYVPNCWMPDGEENWEPVDRIFRALVALDSGVLAMPRITVNAPDWWLKAHPDHEMVMEDGSRCRYAGLNGFATVTSPLYRQDACAYLDKLCRHLMQAFPRNFAGLHFSGQNSNEWFYPNGWTTLSGYDPQTRAAWREWRATKASGAQSILPQPPCGTSGAQSILPQPPCGVADIPSPANRRAEGRSDSLFFDPVADADVVEFNRFLQAEMSDFVAACAKTCRKATEEKKLVASFYGYFWEHTMLPLGPAAGGHYGLSRLLETAGDSLDILSAPYSYRSERGWLGSSIQMPPVESLARRGILLVSEDDTTTHRAFGEAFQRLRKRSTSAKTPGETRDILRRNLAVQAVRGFGSWWMDLCGLGLYKDVALWANVTDFAAFDRAALARSRPFSPDVAMFGDEDSMMFLHGVKSALDAEEWRDPVHGDAAMSEPFAVWGALFAGSWAPLARLGTGYGQYLLADALDGSAPARVQILPVFYADDAKAAALAAMRERDPGRTRVWCWAPAALSPRGLDLAQMARVTGFRFRRVEGFARAVRSTPAGRAEGLPPVWADKLQKRGIAPRFAVVPEEGDEVWAEWEDGSAAVALRRHGDGNEIFFGSIEMPREFLAAVVRRAGVFVSLERPERATFWRSGESLCLQALEDGEQVLLFPEATDVCDGFTGEALASGVTRLPVVMRKGEVRVFSHSPRS